MGSLSQKHELPLADATEGKIIVDLSVLSLKFSPTGVLEFQAGPLLYIVCAAVAFVVLGNRAKWQQWDVVEAEVQLGGIGKVKIKPSVEDVQLAHRAWVELATRKAGVPFDENTDVIIEVYNSWYELFREIRNLAKQVSADKVRNSTDTQELIRVLVDALNKGLRPHLTTWQAKFRRWYTEELSRQQGMTPQEIQQLYPQYQDLVADLKKVSEDLVRYTDLLRMLAHGTSTNESHNG